MKHNVPEFQTFNWFIPCVFWLNLLDHMNANFEDRNQRIKMEEIQLFIYIALFLGVYNLFSTWLFEGFNPRKQFIQFRAMVEQLGGARRYYFSFGSIEIKKNHDEISWYSYLSLTIILHDFEQVLSNDLSNAVFVPVQTDNVVDDNKFSFCSKKQQSMGSPRKKSYIIQLRQQHLLLQLVLAC